MWSGYESDNLGDALADLNDAFGSLRGFGEKAKEFATTAGTLAIPVVGGIATTVGTGLVIDKWVTNATVTKYKWAIAGAVGAAVGAGIAFAKPDWATQGVLLAVGSVGCALALWGSPKLGTLLSTVAPAPEAGLRAYRYANPFNQGNLGAYKLGSPKSQMGNLGRAASVSVGNMVM